VEREARRREGGHQGRQGDLDIDIDKNQDIAKNLKGKPRSSPATLTTTHPSNTVASSTR
jgi:hypothetical protein